MAEPGLFLQLFSLPDLRASGSDRPLLPVGKPLALLAFLAVEARPVPRDELAELLWPSADASRGKASVRQALWNLRKVLPANPFQSDDPLSLAPDAVETDLVRFRVALESGDVEAARSLWKGPLLAGLEFPRTPAWSHWLEELRTQEERRFGATLADAAQKARTAGELRRAVDLLETAVTILPGSAPLHVARVEALLENRMYARADEALGAARRALGDTVDPGVLEGLETRLSALLVDGATDADPQSLQTEFVGRTTEFSNLATSWRQAKAGRSRLSLVLGAPGIGKTRLAAELVALVRSEGHAAVAVKAVAAERGLRWGTASDLVRSLYALPGAAGISNRSASVLARLVPSLGSMGPDIRPPGPGAVEAAAVTDALLDLVNAVAEEGPLLLFVDDLQWVDRDSRAALSHLVRNLKREPVLFLLTCRTGDRDPEVSKAVESLVRTEEVLTTELAPLGLEEVSELLALLLTGVEPEDMDALAQRIQGITQGNPLFIVETLKFLHGEELLEPAGKGKWEIHRSCVDGRLPVPETVESAILRRLEDLGERAQLLALHLARHARPMPTEELRRLTGLDPFEVSEGIGELFDRDLVHRDVQDRIRFVHDAVTEVARSQLDSARWARRASELVRSRKRARRWIPWALGGAAVVALSLAGASGIGPLGFLRPSEGNPATAGAAVAEADLYGGGRIFLYARGERTGHWLRPPAQLGESWSVKDTALPITHSGLDGPFRLPSDSLLWFVRATESPEDPPFIGILQGDGSLDPVWRIPGDVGLKGLSPDGETILLFQQNLDAEWYAHDLVAVDRTSRRGRVLFRAPERITNAVWAPDGLRIALIQRDFHDAIYILDPEGDTLNVFTIDAVPNIDHLAWCPDSEHLAFSGTHNSSRFLGLAEASTGRHETVEGQLLGNMAPICLGSGVAIAYPGQWNGGYGMLVLNLDSGRSSPIFVAPEQSGLLRGRWVPDHVTPVIKHVTIQPSNPEVRWGGRLPLTAVGHYSDGTVQPVGVTWEALDPSRASVDSTGTVTGNQAGTASLVARFASGIADTAQVTVLEWERPDVVLQADFGATELAEWDQFGTPPSRIVDLDGETVLSLEGDGRYRDGMTSKEVFSLESGARVEVIFRLELTQTDRQRISLCVQREGDTPRPQEPAYLGRNTDLSYCVQYPADEQVKFDPQVLRVSSSGYGFNDMVRLPGELDTSSWTLFALEIRPDGQVALYVNQELVRVLAVPLVIEPGSLWKIQLAGASENTHLHVRSLIVYSGAGQGR